MSHSLVIFGASGDLTSRKLIPALYELFRKKRLPESTKIVGVSRTEFTDNGWREKLAQTTVEFLPESFDQKIWDKFAASIFYRAGNIDKTESFRRLKDELESIENNIPTDRVYYLSTAPKFYEPAITNLGRSGLVQLGDSSGRIVIEKPFGVDLDSARKLNESVYNVFDESQIYRIDHYLGKETVSNLLALRFANTIFEPIWNRNYIDHVQITTAEEVKVGRRGDYYETSGVLRDMFQNHLIQLMTLVSMEAPSRIEADAIRDEKVKVLRAIKPMTPEAVETSTLRAQYRTYRDEPGVAADSKTATFAAIRLGIDNWRWQGVPFYLRSGKAMSCRTTQIVIQFRSPPHRMFGDCGQKSSQNGCAANRLILQIQPAEGIELDFQTKVPDTEMSLRQTALNFNFRHAFSGSMPDSYQRLLLDAINGDPSLFSRADEVELAWRLIDPIQKTWDESQKPHLDLYESGDWGPPSSIEWMQRQNRQWFDTCPVLK
jgi:glucose-6-phosphate 1-dehydrogenase